MSKQIYLLIAYETFNQLVKNVLLKSLTILVNRSILDAWLGPKCTSAVGYKIVVENSNGNIFLKQV